MGGSSCSNSIDTSDAQYSLYVVEDNEGYEGYHLVWQDEFEQEGMPNEQYWGYEEGYRRNNEAQDYKKADARTARIEDGCLVLEAISDPHEGINPWTKEPYHFDYSSASLITKNKIAFQYGRIDIAARIPNGRGIWPAFWMLPVDKLEGKYAEIDLMEYVWGNDEQHQTIYSTTHTQFTQDGGERTSGTACCATLESNFHLYSLIWDEQQLEILFDNEVVYTQAKADTDETVDMWPWDQPFYLIMNIAVGGGWGGTWGIDTEMFPKRMEVKYVRYYQKDENTSGGGNTPEQPAEAVNVIPNGNFEKDFDADKTPVFAKDYNIQNGQVMNYINRWFYKGPETEGTTLEVDKTQGANHTKRSLYFKADIPNWWTAYLQYPFQNVEAGEYELSFYAKTNKRTSPFCVSLAFCETEEDIQLAPDKWKGIVISKDGEQRIEGGAGSAQKTVYALMEGVAGNEWQKYSVIVQIPENILMKLILKPHIYTKDGDRISYVMEGNAANAKDTEYWFDELSLKKVE